MSRCFPFPPPGYEKKARNDDDADLLAKVMHKEKKHKKKKKDKDKIEGKEKDKERNKDKHREKKDRKEKHKDKKKDKGRDKDKNKISDQTRNGGTDGCNGDLRERSHQAEGLKDSKLVGELGRRIRDEATGNGNQVVADLIVDDKRRNEGFGRTTERQMEKRAEGKDKNKEKQGDDRGLAKQRDERSGIGNEMVRNIIITDQRRIEGNKSAEKEAEKRIEGKEKNAKGKDGDYGRGEKHKDREHEEKRMKRKDKVRDKEKKNEKEKVKEHGNHKHNKETDKLKEGGRTEQMDDALILKHVYPLKDSGNIATAEENLKRKESKTNGCIHESDLRPNKLLRPAYSSNPHSENGRKLESCSIAIPCAFDRQGASDSKKGKINKVYKANGAVEVQPPSVVPIPSLSAEASENGEAAVTRHSHPDSKYLNQILSVPKMEERSDIDDQEWLFSSNQLKLKPKAAACDASKTPRVWAEAQHIDSADVFALPYVIPY